MEKGGLFRLDGTRIGNVPWSLKKNGEFVKQSENLGRYVADITTNYGCGRIWVHAGDAMGLP